MRFIELKTNGGVLKGQMAFYCHMLSVSRQGFYGFLSKMAKPWKYERLAGVIREIIAEDIRDDAYGRRRVYEAPVLKGIKTPSERTVYRIMERLGLSHPQKRKPNGITKADREARKSDNLLRRDFTADKPRKKCVTEKTGSCTFREYSTASTSPFSAWA